MTSFSLKAALLSVAFAASAGVAHGQALVLITPDEASQPPPKGAVAMAARGVTRGPKIEVTSVGSVSPVKLSVRFQSYGGSSIDLDSVKVIYLRANNVEITDRVKPFMTPSGIDIPEAQMPPGIHVVRVDLKDSDGRTATTSINFKVER